MNLQNNLLNLKKDYDEIKNFALSGLISKEEYYRNLKELVTNNRDSIKDSIFCFFRNDLFIPCNAGRDFTCKEMAAIIINSNAASLKEKISVLKEIVSTCDDQKVVDMINYWIEKKEYYFNYVKGLNKTIKLDSSIAFLSRDMVFSCFDNFCSCPYNSFGDLSVSFLDNYDGYICKIKRFNKNFFYPNKTGEDSVTDIDFFVSNRRYWIEEYDHNFKGFYNFDLENVVVKLEHPFLPFDFIHFSNSVPPFEDAIVANSDDQYVKQIADKEVTFHGRYWLELDLPNYYLETNPYSGNGVKAGELTQSYCHKKNNCGLDDIRLVDESNMTMKQVEYIKKVRNLVKERK